MNPLQKYASEITSAKIRIYALIFFENFFTSFPFRFVSFNKYFVVF